MLLKQICFQTASIGSLEKKIGIETHVSAVYLFARKNLNIIGIQNRGNRIASNAFVFKFEKITCWPFTIFKPPLEPSNSLEIRAFSSDSRREISIETALSPEVRRRLRETRRLTRKTRSRDKLLRLILEKKTISALREVLKKSHHDLTERK